MTEIGEILIEEEIEEEVVEEKEAPEYEKFLNKGQVEALKKAGLVDKISIRAASDEDLIKLDGIGAATVVKLREWGVGDVKEGDAISLRCLVLKREDEVLEVAPGDIIPARFDAARAVEKGQATWE